MPSRNNREGNVANAYVKTAMTHCHDLLYKGSLVQQVYT